MSQNGQTHFKNLAANARFFGTLFIKGLKLENWGVFNSTEGNRDAIYNISYNRTEKTLRM